MLKLRQTPVGTLLPVKAHPAAKANEVKGIHDGRLKVSITQSPERGKANKAIALFLAKFLGIKKSQVELSSGATSTDKEFLILGLDLTALQARVESLLE